MTEENREINQEVNQETSPSFQDYSNVKIRTILKHRLKNHKFSFKRILPFIVVAVVFFAAGFGIDRAVMKHRVNKISRENMNIGRKFQNNYNDKANQNKNIPFFDNNRGPRQ